MAEKATSYTSILQNNQPINPNDSLMVDDHGKCLMISPSQTSKAFSLPKFIPLLMERIYVLNPFTRIFLVSWLTLLDSIPDLELISYLPSFLGGLIDFLNDSHKDVRVVTHSCLNLFLQEIKRISKIKETVLNSNSNSKLKSKRYNINQYNKSHHNNTNIINDDHTIQEEIEAALSNGIVDSEFQNDENFETSSTLPLDQSSEVAVVGDDDPNIMLNNEENEHIEGQDEENQLQDSDSDDSSFDEGLYISGQDIEIDYSKTIEILLSNINSIESEIQLVILNWIDVILDINPKSFLPFIPKLLSILLKIVARDDESLNIEASKVNTSLLLLIKNLPVSEVELDSSSSAAIYNDDDSNDISSQQSDESDILNELTPAVNQDNFEKRDEKLNYLEMINTLRNEFLDNHNDILSSKFEISRITALDWLIVLYEEAPKKKIYFKNVHMHNNNQNNDGINDNINTIANKNDNENIFKTLLKVLSDPSEKVILKDLILLSKISLESNDEEFQDFMFDLLELFKDDSNLLKIRGNQILRQLCSSLNSKRIYKSLAILLENENDLNFASKMVQILNINLISSPELLDLRNSLKNPDLKDESSLFYTLFKAWSHNSPAALSLCLLSQTYEHAYSVLQMFVEFEITIDLLIQIDMLVQLLESPVFTKLRLQLLEPERYPYLYKCLYGILMLLPQSTAFNTLNNRLNCINGHGMGFFSTTPSSIPNSNLSQANLNNSNSNLNMRSRLKTIAREEPIWEILLNKFKIMQQKHDKFRQNENRNKNQPFLASSIDTGSTVTLTSQTGDINSNNTNGSKIYEDTTKTNKNNINNITKPSSNINVTGKIQRKRQMQRNIGRTNSNKK